MQAAPFKFLVLVPVLLRFLIIAFTNFVELIFISFSLSYTLKEKSGSIILWKEDISRLFYYSFVMNIQ